MQFIYGDLKLSAELVLKLKLKHVSIPYSNQIYFLHFFFPVKKIIAHRQFGKIFSHLVEAIVITNQNIFSGDDLFWIKTSRLGLAKI